MSKLRVGFIGTGKKPEKPGPRGYGMAHKHAAAYARVDGCEIVAVADLSKENAEAFCDLFDAPKEKIYTDYKAMLAEENLDIVSICTWPHLHAPMTIACAEAKVQGVFCEKPMAYTWGDSKAMHAACEKNGVKLAFNHQRRYSKVFREAKRLIDEGAIGELLRVETAAPFIYDYGTHSIDLSNYLAGEQGAKWVFGQIDYRTENKIFGAHNENQNIIQWQYENGVYGLSAGGSGCKMIPAHNKAIGADGEIECGPSGPGEHASQLRVRRAGDKAWAYIDCGDDTVHGTDLIDRAVADFVAKLKDGEDGELCSANALKATEIIFAAFESSRRRGRVDLPLDVDDNPLHEMVAAGDLKPAPKD